jgi:hypothetical protein
LKSFFKYSCVFTVKACLKIFEKIERIEKIEKIEKTLLTFPGLPEPVCKEYCSWGSSGRTILFLGAQVEQFCSWGGENTVLLYLSFPTNRIALYQACLGRENEEELVYEVPRKCPWPPRA